MTRRGPKGPHYDARIKAERAFQLHSVGRTWDEVARETGYASRGAAQTAVKRLLDRTPKEDTEAARRSALESLRITSSILFARFADAATRQDDAAVVALNGALHRNRDQVAKFLGLYAPAQVDVTVSTSPAEILDRAEAELLALVPPVIDAEIEETA